MLQGHLKGLPNCYNANALQLTSGKVTWQDTNMHLRGMVQGLPVLLLQCKVHASLLQALVVHLVCDNCCLCKGLQRQVKLQLSDTMLHELLHLRTKWSD